MKTTNKLQTLAELHFHNDLNDKSFIKIGRKIYSVYCVAINKIGAYNYEYIFILQDEKLNKIFFPSNTKARFII